MADKLTKDDPEATELLDLDVRFVSGVGEPATGKRWLLAKSSKGGGPAQGETETVRQPEGDKRMEDTQHGAADMFAEFGRRLAAAFGVQTADETMTEAAEALKTIAQKAQGQAPADDTSGKPSYAGMNKPKNNLPGKAPDTSSTTAPKLASAGVDGSVATQQVETIVGSEVTTPNKQDVVQGRPVVKSNKAMVARLLKQLEDEATNPEALEDAQAALEAAFAEPEEEQHMTDEAVRDLLLKALEPIIDAVEEMQTQVQGMAKSVEEAEDPRVEQLEERLTNLENQLSAVASVARAEPTERRVAKSRVPTIVTQPTSKDALWAASPFDVAAGID